MINGHTKFFSLPVSQSVRVTHNPDTANHILNPDASINWFGATASTITLYCAPNIINRIYCGGHNLANYTIKYSNNGVLTDFTNVYSLDKQTTQGISETGYTDNTSYYEFDEVITDKIVLDYTGNSSNGQINFIGATYEIGTFQQPKEYSNEAISTGIKKIKNTYGRSMPSYNADTFSCTIKANICDNQNDLDVFEYLLGCKSKYLVWMCGGDTKGILLKRRNWRLQDIYLVATQSSNSIIAYGGLQGLGFKGKIKLMQSDL
jgi:hypothetical protein